MCEELKYLIWSNKHYGWLTPSKNDYAGLINRACRYDLATAEQICQDANEHPDGDEPHAVMVLAPECLETSHG